MKTIPALLQADYESNCSTICKCLKITRTDGVVLGFTETDREITVSAVVYEPGFAVSQLSSTANLGVDNLELTIIPDEGSVPEVDLVTGLWNNAAFEIFEVNHKATGNGVNILKRGTTGEVEVRRGSYVVEFRGLAQSLQQTMGHVTQRTCRARFADFPSAVPGAACRLNVADWTETGTITGVTSRQIATDSGRGEADEYFAEGHFTFDTGENEGYSQKVKIFASGQFTFSLPFPFDIAIGDTYTVIAGCKKRHDVDCATKFDNIVNFQGEPHMPGVDSLTRPAGTAE